MQTHNASQADPLGKARSHAESGQFVEMMAECQGLLAQTDLDFATCLNVGALLAGYGFLSDASRCYERARSLAPNDLRAIINLANIAHDSGDHGQSRRLYAKLLQVLPDHPVIRRNALTSLEYDPDVTELERLSEARAWGDWAIARAGGECPRPPFSTWIDRPLRIGYVSADLCQHTVGLFVKDVFRAHDKSRVEVFAYSAGSVSDRVTDRIRAACTLREVSSMDDAMLVDLIRADRIDVLIDLSGHTGGSRLTAFAHRPAPVMVSWLGYFATTGLSYMDAVLLDTWHAPPGTEAQFVEPIVRMPSGRFCYQPIAGTPAHAVSPPLERNGYITFGCFNNTAKLNDGVLDVWSRLLQALPSARLILKWRTFNDETFRHRMTQAFADRGVAADRIELRGPSFHQEMLKEYADIDIALDPFPFTGGLTSCESLWMGVPVVTLPQHRVVSRQTSALLNQIGLPDLVAKDADDYVRIALELVNHPKRLANLRATMRDRMRASPLMDVKGFTRQLEKTLIDLYQRIKAP